MTGAAYAQIGAPDEIDRLIGLCAGLNLVGRVELLRAVRDTRSTWRNRRGMQSCRCACLNHRCAR